LGVFKRCIRDQLAGLEIHEPEDDRGGPEVHGETVDGPGGAVHFFAVHQDAIPVPGDRRV
jgi:hypothetical protein